MKVWETYRGTSRSDYYVHMSTRKDLRAFGGNGNDTISGFGNGDIIYGENGNDLLDGNVNANTYNEPFNNRDELYGGYGNDTLKGANGADWLEGQENNDLLLGRSNSDTLIGGSGDDKLIGGYNTTVDQKEYDQLNGGLGKDQFILCDDFGYNYYQGEGYATITDYNQYEDTITVKKGSVTQSQEHRTGSRSKLDTVIYQGNDAIAVLADYTGTVYAINIEPSTFKPPIPSIPSIPSIFKNLW